MKDKTMAWRRAFVFKNNDSGYWLDQAKNAVNCYGYVIIYENLDKLHNLKARNEIRKDWTETKFMIKLLAKLDPWAVNPLRDCYYKLLKVHQRNKAKKELSPEDKLDEHFYCQSMWHCIREMANKYDIYKEKYDRATSLNEVV